MTRGLSFKQFVALVTKWVHDEFLIVWCKLVSIYIATSVFFLSILSYVIYLAIRGNLLTILAQSFYDPFTEQMILIDTLEVLKARILLADFFMLIIVVVVAVFLTSRTLAPIRKNIEKQKRFIADASHELRTPLSILKLELELVARQKKFDETAIRASLNNLQEEVDRIIDLTNSLLTLSKNKKGENAQQMIHLEPFLKKITDNFKLLAEKKDINISFISSAPKATFRAYPMDIERVFNNIIKNAYQYTPAGGDIQVVLSKKGNESIITITDTGIGISEENIQKIFEPFYQEKTSHTGEGAGLGLALVKKILDDHDSRIEIESKKNMGTTVKIYLV